MRVERSQSLATIIDNNDHEQLATEYRCLGPCTRVGRDGFPMEGRTGLSGMFGLRRK